MKQTLSNLLSQLSPDNNIKRALVIVDVQNDFISGSLAVQDGEQIAHRIATILDLDAYDHIVTTQDWHTDPGSHWSDEPDFVDSWPVHAKAGTWGAQLSPRLDPILHRIEAHFRKGEYAASYSGFNGTADDHEGLADWLRRHEVTDVDIVGIATDYSVKATALDAMKEGFGTRVLAHLTAAVDASLGGSLSKAIPEMRQAGVDCAEHGGGEVLQTEDSMRTMTLLGENAAVGRPLGGGLPPGRGAH